jgi:trans-aconitate 2-methyltransferase
LSADTWEPDTYSRFAAERSRPFFDLLELVKPIPAGRAVDLGCGTGALTLELHRRVGAAETLGIDSSPAMLEKAAPLAGNGLRFERGDLAAFPSDGVGAVDEPNAAYGLVFSNAALQWVPDHPNLLARLTRALEPGGQLAFQVPVNFGHATHRSAERVAGEEPFRSALGGGSHSTSTNVLAPEAYATLLHRLGFAEQIVRLEVYGSTLASREDIVEWVKGSLLTEYRRRLPADLYPTFVDRYRETLFQAIPDERPYFLTYNRILVRARLTSPSPR